MAVRDPFSVAHERLGDHDARALASSLQDVLGQKLVAFALGDRHPKTIGRYARGERAPNDQVHGRLVNLFIVVEILKVGMRDAVVKSWMLGANPRLRGKAPIEAFHEGKQDLVREAAQLFVSSR
jgi:hypothetical protein